MHRSLVDWLTYLESLHPKTIALGLERVAAVKQRLNLQPGFPIITVGGTNGKGSVCAMLESILHAAGYRVGCYTSPHLLDYNERVRIGKRQASSAELCAAFEEVERARCGRVDVGRDSSRQGLDVGMNPDLQVPLTYFEFGTLAAIQCFIGHKVEIAILEVGLGGRLDAVNVFGHDCAVVTSVDIDHTDYLGNTREAIAYEKAGIFRTGKVAIFGDADMPEAIASEAQRIGAKLWQLGKEFGFDERSLTPTLSQREREQDQKQWNYRSTIGARNALPYPALRGAYQLNNASAALAALDALKDKLPVSMEAVRRGLVEVALPGRFQVLPGRPQIILDVAHNPHAARALARNLADMPPCGKTFAVFSMLGDKDIAGVARALDGQVDVWLAAGIGAPRGLPSAELARLLHDAGVKGAVRTFDTVADAVRQASKEAAENDRIAAFGSFCTVAETMRARGLRYS
ncbi:MAG: dihydrofolate synthase / folylpolyglutamate synthase [Gallionellaceae bacterium]|nr:MAG: dihydrofolate synthase / folylpolyglutamate synthase [Gallionellaceae bacterium]